jgi:hypothetical protein
MARYWIRYPENNSVHGGWFGFTFDEMWGFVTRQTIFENAHVSYDKNSWYEARQFQELQPAFDQVRQNPPARPNSKTCWSCGWVFVAWIVACPRCHATNW